MRKAHSNKKDKFLQELKSPEYSFIVDFWCFIFGILRYISIVTILRRIFYYDKKKTPEKPMPFVHKYLFIDILVTSNTWLSVISLYISMHISNYYIKHIFVGYGFIRILDMFVTQVNILLFDEYRAHKGDDSDTTTKSIRINQKSNKPKKQKSTKHKPNMYAIKSSRRIIILLLHNFAEIVFWFSTSYIVFAGNFNIDLTNKSILEVIYISFIKTTNFGSTDFIHKTFYGMDIIWLQAFIGLFMTLLMLARFIGTLPLPTIREE